MSLLALLFAALILLATSTFYRVGDAAGDCHASWASRYASSTPTIADEPFGRTGAGISLKIPFLEDVVYIDKRVQDLNMEPQTVLSTDQLRVVVDAFARFRVTDPLQHVPVGPIGRTRR